MIVRVAPFRIPKGERRIWIVKVQTPDHQRERVDWQRTSHPVRRRLLHIVKKPVRGFPPTGIEFQLKADAIAPQELLS